MLNQSMKEFYIKLKIYERKNNEYTPKIVL